MYIYGYFGHTVTMCQRGSERRHSDTPVDWAIALTVQMVKCVGLTNSVRLAHLT